MASKTKLEMRFKMNGQDAREVVDICEVFAYYPGLAKTTIVKNKWDFNGSIKFLQVCRLAASLHCANSTPNNPVLPQPKGITHGRHENRRRDIIR